MNKTEENTEHGLHKCIASRLRGLAMFGQISSKPCTTTELSFSMRHPTCFLLPKDKNFMTSLQTTSESVCNSLSLSQHPIHTETQSNAAEISMDKTTVGYRFAKLWKDLECITFATSSYQRQQLPIGSLSSRKPICWKHLLATHQDSGLEDPAEFREEISERSTEVTTYM
jgi:hypothetical protein